MHPNQSKYFHLHRVLCSTADIVYERVARMKMLLSLLDAEYTHRYVYSIHTHTPKRSKAAAKSRKDKKD